MPPERILFVGLGNYTHPNTRHNAGMLVLDYLAQRLNLSWAQHKPWKAHVASTILTLPFSPGDQERSVYELTLLKPRLLMNVSGSSVARAVRDLSITGSNVYVFHDDLQRDLGKASLKRDGSANGHNGIKSTIQNLKTDEFWRVRIGIGRPVSRQEAEVADYVLSKFSANEMDMLAKKIYPLFDIGPGLGLETLLLRNRLWEFPKPPKKKKTKVQPNTSQQQQQQQQQAQTVNQTENQTSATSPPDIAVTA